MRVTRFTQSCLLIESEKTRILIDASADELASLDKFGQLDAVLYTHEHSDHFDPETAKRLSINGAKIFANASTAAKMSSAAETVSNGQELDIKDLSVKVIELPHCPLPDGGDGPQNTGYLINGELFVPGDGKELEGLQVANLALPITGPDISMKDCYSFAKQLGAEKVIPIHYDKIGAKPEVYAAFAARVGFEFEFVILANGQGTEL